MRKPATTADRDAFHRVYLRVLLAFATRVGISEVQAPASWAPASQTQALPLSAAQQLITVLLKQSGDAQLGLRFGRELQMHAHGEVGLAALTAPTWQEAFATFAQFGALRAPILEFTTTTDARSGMLAVRPVQSLGTIHAFVFDTLAVIVDQLAEALLGEPARALQHHLPYPSAFAGTRCQSALAGDVRFGSDAVYRVQWPASHAQRTCLTADAQAHARAVAECERAQERLHHAEITTRVRSLLLASKSHWPSAEQIAAQLNMSVRNLFRQLAACGSSYQFLLDEARLARAHFLLSETDLSVAAIAERLGFADTSNFARTFRRLAGVTPVAFRRAQRRAR